MPESNGGQVLLFWLLPNGCLFVNDSASGGLDGRDLVRRILPLMSQHTDDFGPKSYALWYAFVVGAHPGLCREIERLIGSGQRLSEPVTVDLYQRYLIDSAQADVAEAQDALMSLLVRAREHMDSAGSETSRFNATLAEFGSALGTHGDVDRLKSEVENMAGETSRIGDTIDRLLTEVRDSQAEIARLSLELTRARDEASTDALTGLANRGAFDAAMRELCSQHNPTELSLVMLDIDHFKRINDSFGHPYGDHVIRQTAGLIHALMRGEGMVARYGGEEFAVLLIGADGRAAEAFAEKTRTEISQARFRDHDGVDAGRITVSAGVAEHAWRELPEGLLGRADRALYRAKTLGRDRVVLAGA